jgi:hypothetical protein
MIRVENVMPNLNTDRNLLAGILALQLDLISRDALIRAMNAWSGSEARWKSD